MRDDHSLRRQPVIGESHAAFDIELEAASCPVVADDACRHVPNLSS
jgi:hypothetical protein